MFGKTRDMALTAVFAALMSVCSWISIPAPVPYTLQTFGVFVSIGLLGGRRGTMAVVLYILLGMAGLPVFAGFSGGPGVVFSSVGGYIVGFLLAVLAMWGFTRCFGSGTAALGLAMALGLMICYVFGTLWFVTFSDMDKGFFSALSICVLPFILPDAAKLALALIITRRLKPRIQ